MNSLEKSLRKAFPFLTDADFGYHATDLYVLFYPDVFAWLKKNHEFPQQILTFEGQGDWQGKTAIEIPFAGKWPNGD